MRPYLICCLLASFVFGCAEQPDYLINHIRVIWQNDPATDAIVSWTSGVESSTFNLQLFSENSLRQRKLIKTVTPQKIGQFKNSHNLKLTRHSYYYHANISDLQPSTNYYFQISSQFSESSTYYFTTASPDGDWQIIAGGDSRSDRFRRKEINYQIQKAFQSNPEILAFLHGGDFVASGSNWQEWDNWLEDHEITYQNDGRILPLIPTRGNHEDNEELYNQVFAWPGGGSGYYKIKLPKANIIVLNTEKSMAGDQNSWLKQELSEDVSSGKQSLISYHRPAFPAVKSPSLARDLWVPLFEQFKVKLVFESDGHAYKRTAPIKGNKLVSEQEGTIYVGEGGLGVRQRTPNPSRWYFNGGFTKSSHHFLVVSQKSSSIDVVAVNEFGEAFDNFSVKF